MIRKNLGQGRAAFEDEVGAQRGRLVDLPQEPADPEILFHQPRTQIAASSGFCKESRPIRGREAGEFYAYRTPSATEWRCGRIQAGAKRLS